MAKAQTRREQRKRGQREEDFPLRRENFIILGVGLLVILLGYAAMLEGSVEGFLPLTVAPILLVLGYCVIFPLGILYRRGERSGDATREPRQTGAASA
jgi:hypothetical protein